MTHIVVVGAGGVGAETLQLLQKTPGNAKIRVIDRDFVDADTLKRQTLYRKADVSRLKAFAAARKLGHRFTGVSEHLHQDNAENLLQGADIVLDCTDNWATRCVINQWALKHRKPWIFTSAIRSQTMTSTLTPKTACFLCWNPHPAVPRSCRIEGIRKETTAMAAKTQASELVSLLAAKPNLAGKLQFTDIRSKTCTTVPLSKNKKCPACVKKTFTLAEEKAVTLCGDDEYLFQLDSPIDSKALASLKPQTFGDVLKIKWKTGELVIFKSGRILARKMARKQAEAAVDTIRQKQAS